MKKAKYQKLNLQSFSIETGGGMNGGKNILRVNLSGENKTVTVYKSVNKIWYLYPQAELHLVDSSLLDEIKQVIIDEKLYNAPNIPRSEMLVLDAATTSYHILFSDGEYLYYSSVQQLSRKIYEAHDKIKALIEKYCNEGATYPTIYVKAEGERVFWKEQEAVTIDCSNEGAFKINLNIYNGKDDMAELTGGVVLSKINSNEGCRHALVENYTVSVYPKSQEYIILTLPFEYCSEEGLYKIEYAGCETTFEMKAYKI